MKTTCIAFAVAAAALLAPFSNAEEPPADENAGAASPSPRPVSLQDVVVTPARAILGDPLSEKEVLASEAMKLPLIDNDLFRAVQQHPGVTGGDFTGRFGVRGGEVDETAVYLDGMELFMPFHLQDFGGAISIVDLLAVSSATLYLGAAPADFGDALSAVLDIRLREPPEKIRIDAGLDVLNAHLFAAGGDFTASGRAGYIGLLMGMMDSDEVFEPHYADVLLRYSGEVSARDRVSVNVLYAADTNRIDNAGVNDDLNSRFHNLSSWLRWTRKLGGRDRFDFMAYGGGYSQWRRSGSGDRDDRDLGYAGAKSSVEIEAGADLLIKAGLDCRWMRGRYDYLEQGQALDLDVEESGVSLKGYVSARWRPVPFLTAELGGRMLHLTTIGATDFGPVAAISVDGGSGVTLRAAAGVYYQPVDPLHVPVESGSGSLAQPERAYHVLFGAQFADRKIGINARAEVYHKEMDRLAGFVRDFGSRTSTHAPSDRASASGMEMSLDKDVAGVKLHAAFTYSFSRERSDGAWGFSDRDQRYAFQAGASADLGYGWSAFVSWRYHSGNPYTEVWYEGSTRFEGPRNGARLPPYHSLDARVSRNFRWQGMEIQFYAQVLNAYNRMNIHEYYMEEKVVNGVTVHERRNEYLFPILPTLGINVSF